MHCVAVLVFARAIREQHDFAEKKSIIISTDCFNVHKGWSAPRSHGRRVMKEEKEKNSAALNAAQEENKEGEQGSTEQREEPVRAVFGVSSDGGTDMRLRFGKDKYSFLWGLLSFFAPLVAFALRNLWRRNYPLRAKSMLIGSILGIIFYLALFATAIALICVKVLIR